MRSNNRAIGRSSEDKVDSVKCRSSQASSIVTARRNDTLSERRGPAGSSDRAFLRRIGGTSRKAPDVARRLGWPTCRSESSIVISTSGSMKRRYGRCEPINHRGRRLSASPRRSAILRLARRTSARFNRFGAPRIAGASRRARRQPRIRPFSTYRSNPCRACAWGMKRCRGWRR